MCGPCAHFLAPYSSSVILFKLIPETGYMPLWVPSGVTSEAMKGRLPSSTGAAAGMQVIETLDASLVTSSRWPRHSCLVSNRRRRMA